MYTRHETFGLKMVIYDVMMSTNKYEYIFIKVNSRKYFQNIYISPYNDLVINLILHQSMLFQMHITLIIC